MEECVACKSVDEIRGVLHRMKKYRSNPSSFVYDREKAAREKAALAKRKEEEGKRKRFEARMIRKAKREERADLEHYLRIGAEVPTLETVDKLRGLSKEKQLSAWKVDHLQHCLSYHLHHDGCKRGRACAFLHVDPAGANTFDEADEVAG